MPTKRWTRLEYDRLIEKGVFGPDDRIELLGGELVVREPQRTPHATAIELALDALRAHPARPALILEAAEATLALDRECKGSLYARAGITDYWIVNLVDHVLEVHREPTADADAPYRWRYGSAVRLRAGDTVTPLAAPRSSIPVADLIP